MTLPSRVRASVLWGLALAAGAAAFSLFVALNGPAARLDVPLDDAWIHLVYVRGLWRDGLPTYNPGVPEAGFSSPLWLLALALPFRLAVALGASPVWPAKLASLAFGVVTAGGLGRLVERMGAPRGAVLLAVALALLAPSGAFSAASGMEVTLASAALAWALVALHDARPWRAGALLGLAVLARPEAALAVAVLAAHEALAPGSARQRLGRAVAAGVPAAAGALAWGAYNLWATGHPLPNTFYVKATQRDLAASAKYFAVSVVGARGAALAVLTLALAGLGLWLAWRAGRGRRTARATALVVAVSTAGVVATRALPPGVGFYGQRYFYPFTLLGVAFVAWGLAAVAGVLRDEAWRARRPWRIAAAGACAAFALLGTAALLDARWTYAANSRDIHRFHTVPAREVARFVAPGAVIAVEGAGSARFHGGHVTLDLVGLNDHRLAHTRGDNRARTCRIVNLRPSVFLVPAAWVEMFRPAFELSVVRVYEAPDWSILEPPRPFAVVALAARARPGILASCARDERAAPAR